jgi:hypothetical protein
MASEAGDAANGTDPSALAEDLEHPFRRVARSVRLGSSRGHDAPPGMPPHDNGPKRCNAKARSAAPLSSPIAVFNLAQPHA